MTVLTNVVGDRAVCDEDNFAGEINPYCDLTYKCDYGSSTEVLANRISYSFYQFCDPNTSTGAWEWQPFINSFTQPVECRGVQYDVTCNWNK